MHTCRRLRGRGGGGGAAIRHVHWQLPGGDGFLGAIYHGTLALISRQIICFP